MVDKTAGLFAQIKMFLGILPFGKKKKKKLVLVINYVEVFVHVREF